MKFTKITDTIYTLTDAKENEYAEIILFYLFPGIFLGINYVNMHRIICPPSESSTTPSMDCLRINYCFEGRCEVKLKDGRYVYVDNNVLCIEDHTPQYNFHYPLGFYKGIEISIDKNILSSTAYEALDLFGVNPYRLIEKYGNNDETFIHIASDLFAEKSAEIVSIWENDTLETDAKIHQLRFVLCQLLYDLIYDQAVNWNKVCNASSLSHGQYMIALDCERKITKDLSKKLTIASMASDYKVSPTSVKKFFTQVYGCSISEYLQTIRMKKAAQMLINESLSVMEIAAAVGYENQSKFSAVFKKHTGYAPLEYKKIYTIKRNEETT